MRYLISFTLVLVLFSASAQNEAVKSAAPADSIPFEIRKQAYIYNMAKKYNDPAVARMALYNLIASTPNSLNLMDTLALMYLEYEQYASAALISQDVSSINPNDIFAAEVAAIAFENLGVKNKAVDFYEKLYLNNNNLSTLYKITFLQYQLKRYGEAINNADILIASEKSDEMMLYFPLENQQNQPVSMKVGAIRLKGMIEEDRGNTSLAKELFQKALDMKPDFEILKQQIAELEK